MSTSQTVRPEAISRENAISICKLNIKYMSKKAIARLCLKFIQGVSNDELGKILSVRIEDKSEANQENQNKNEL